MAVVGLPQPLEGLALVGVLQRELGQRKGRPLGEFGAQPLGNGGDFVGMLQFGVEATPDLIDSIARLTTTQRSELVAIEVVERGARGQVVDASIVRL